MDQGKELRKVPGEGSADGFWRKTFLRIPKDDNKIQRKIRDESFALTKNQNRGSP